MHGHPLPFVVCNSCCHSCFAFFLSLSHTLSASPFLPFSRKVCVCVCCLINKVAFEQKEKKINTSQAINHASQNLDLMLSTEKKETSLKFVQVHHYTDSVHISPHTNLVIFDGHSSSADVNLSLADRSSCYKVIKNYRLIERSCPLILMRKNWVRVGAKEKETRRGGDGICPKTSRKSATNWFLRSTAFKLRESFFFYFRAISN